MTKKETESQEKNIPLLDCPFDYLVGDASGKVLNEYGRFPCKIKCGVYALIVRGSAKATVNITEYEFKENDLLWLEPGGFLLIHEFTEDALVYYILFSSAFMEKNTFNSHVTMNQFLEKSPIVHLTEDVSRLYRNALTLMMDASNCEPSMLSSQKMVHVFNLLQTCYLDFQKRGNYIIKPQDRKQEIYQAYIKMVLDHYHEWHHVAQYAEELRITLPHLCSTIKSVSGKTAGDLIIDAILTDAKAQLKLTSLQIKEIAINLGFENVAFFNRFFKSHTGVTPKGYRNDTEE